MNPQPRSPQPVSPRLGTPHPHADAAMHTHTHMHQRPGSGLGRLRTSPARSLLGAGVFARLGLAAAALVLLWTTILWALR